MAYATTPQLEEHLGATRFVELTDRDASGASDAAAVTQALAGASSIADSYIAAYLPIGTPPAVLVEAVMDIATYKLAGNRRTEDERLKFEDAMKWLRDVGADRARLGPPEGALEPTGGNVIVDAPTAEFAFSQTRRIL